FLVHPVLKPSDHLLHDLEAIGHRRGANLNVAGTQRKELGRVAPCRYPTDARNRQAARFGIACDLRHHIQRDGLYRRSAIPAMGAFAVDRGFRRERVEIDRSDRRDGVDERNRIRPALLGRARGITDVGDIGRQLHDHRHACVVLAPAHDHFDVFGHLAYGRTHAALAHSMRATEVELDAVTFGFLHRGQDRLPAFLHARHHYGSHECAIRPLLLDLLDLLKIDLELAVRDEFDIVEAQKPPVRSPDRAVTGTVYVDDRGTFFAQPLPHHATPARLEGTYDIVGLVGGGRRSQPEGIRALDANEIVANVCHAHALPFEVSARWMLSPASRPAATAETVRSSRASATQSPPAQTFGMEVRPSASTLMRPRSSSTVMLAPLSGSGTKDWPMALNT